MVEDSGNGDGSVLGNELEGECFLGDGVATELCIETKGQPEKVGGVGGRPGKAQQESIDTDAERLREPQPLGPQEAGEARAPGKLETWYL